jgi:hypothetical protein
MRAPCFESSARLEWRLRYGEITFYPEQPSVSYSFTPVFPGCSDELAERGIVWNLWALMASVRQPGAFSILNSECGYPPDANLEELVLVSHPASDSVVWELDINGLRPALGRWLSEPDGFIRLVFVREEYEADIRAMLREVRLTHGMPVLSGNLTGAYGYAHLRQEYPADQSVVADIFEPTCHGDGDGEELAALDAEAVWSREAIFPVATELDIGFFGDRFFQIDGVARHDWIGHWFTNWSVLGAFRQWTAYVMGAYGMRSTPLGKHAQLPESLSSNTLVLLPERDIESCHRAGEYFVQTVQRSFQEGKTAPDVAVHYVRIDLPYIQHPLVGGVSA